MSRGGVVVDRVVACPGIGSGQAVDTLVSIVGESGDYHAVRVASDRVQFARTFRPTWATILGWCTIILAFVGVVFFFVKTTETCIAVVEADHRGTRIRLSGRLDAVVLQRLLAAFDDPAGAARDAALAAAVGAPVDSAMQTAAAPISMAPPTAAPVSFEVPVAAAPASMAPPSGAPVSYDLPAATPGPPQFVPQQPVPPAFTPPPFNGQAPVGMPAPTGEPVLSQPSADAPPAAAPVFPPAAAPVFPPSPEPVFPQAEPAPKGGWVPVWERDDAPGWSEPVAQHPESSGSSLGFDPTSTIIMPKRNASGATTLRAVLDDGTDLDLSSVVLLGRDPSAGPTEHGANLVAVADPERSVSKTHLKVELIGGVVLATDRGSTNGSALVLADGTENALEPGVPTEVPSGCVVRFGTRTVRVLSAGAIGGPL